MSTEDPTAPRGKLRLADPSATASSAMTQAARPRGVHVERGTEQLFRLDDRFHDEGEIGRGGMGAVHRVLERSLNRAVAVKILPAPLAMQWEVRSRFLTEAQVTGQLEHPNIVPVYELGTDDTGALFFSMRLIEGQTFTAWLKSNPMRSDEDIEAAMEIFLRVCDAVSFAHSRNVVHRDLKPENVMVADHGQVYLMDWGIARVLHEDRSPPNTSAEKRARVRTTKLTLPPPDDTGRVLGTYAYMSPEQATGKIEEVDPRTDVFGLGAMLYRIVTGLPPIRGDNPGEALILAANAEIGSPGNITEGLPKALLEVSLKAMQRLREHRFQSVADFKHEVQQVLRGRFRHPVVCHPAGTLIVGEGHVGAEAYYIRSGICRVFRERDGVKHTLLELGPGEVFGETAVFTGQPRNASVEAETNVELVVVPGEHLSEQLGLGSWMGAFVRSLGNRFSERSKKVTELQDALHRSELLCAAWKALANTTMRDTQGRPMVLFEMLLDSIDARRAEPDRLLIEKILEEEGFLLTNGWLHLP